MLLLINIVFIYCCLVESLSREPSESISPEKSISCLNIPPVDKPTLPAPSGIASFSLTSFDVPENGISTVSDYIVCALVLFLFHFV